MLPTFKQMVREGAMSILDSGNDIELVGNYKGSTGNLTKQINRGLDKLKGSYSTLSAFITDLFKYLPPNAKLAVNDGRTEWSGTFTGSPSTAVNYRFMVDIVWDLQYVKNRVLTFTLYKRESGDIEVVAYVG